MSSSISMPSLSGLSSSGMMNNIKSKFSSFGMSGGDALSMMASSSGLLSMGSSLGLGMGSKFGKGMMTMPCCKGKRMRGGLRAMQYSSVLPGLGDKSVEREVKKYIDDSTLSMLLYKAIATTKPKKRGRKGRKKGELLFIESYQFKKIYHKVIIIQMLIYIEY